MKDNLQKKAKTKRRLWPMLMGMCLILGVLVMGYWFAVNSPLFGMTEFYCTGNSHLADNELKQLMGVSLGDNLLALSPELMCRGLMTSPWIIEASVRKQLPHRLIVLVKEAEPEAILKRGLDYYIVDNRGVELERLSSAEERFLPLITTELASGMPAAMSNALELAGAIKEAGLLKSKTAEIIGADEGAEDLSVKVDGVVVKFGEGFYKDKIARLFELAREIEDRKINVDYIDLRFSNRVVVKQVKEAEDGKTVHSKS